MACDKRLAVSSIPLWDSTEGKGSTKISQRRAFVVALVKRVLVTSSDGKILFYIYSKCSLESDTPYELRP